MPRNSFVYAAVLPAIFAAGTAAGAQDDYKAHFDAGYDALKKADYDRAIVEFDAVIRLNPQVPGAYLNRGFCRYKKGQMALAIADYSACAEKCGADSDFRTTRARALTNRGDCHLRRGDTTQAMSDAEAALAVEPDFPFAYRLRACLYYHLGEYEKAVADYDQAQKLQPDIAPLTLTREGAAANARKRAGADNDPKALFVRARTALERATASDERNADLDTAIAALDRLTRLDPDNAEAWCLRGQAAELASPGDPPGEKAIGFYDRSIASNPRCGEAYLRRGLLRVRARESAGADERRKGIADLDTAIGLGIRDAAAFFERGQDRLSRQDYDGAIADFDRALSLQPGFEQARQSRESARQRKVAQRS